MKNSQIRPLWRRLSSMAILVVGLGLPASAYVNPLPPPGRRPTVSIAGRWTSDIGVHYEFAQTCDRFTWQVIEHDEQGTGTLDGLDFSASWTGNLGSGSANGRITDLDPFGNATQIEWNNGVVFARDVPPPRPSPGVSIEGTWNSNIWLQYEIIQAGDHFTWQVIGHNEPGRGTLDGMNLSASWTGNLGSGSANGRITNHDRFGNATQIEWNNGVVFHREPAAAPRSGSAAPKTWEL